MDGLFMRANGSAVVENYHRDRYIKEKMFNDDLPDQMTHRRRISSTYEKLLRENCGINRCKPKRTGNFDQVKNIIDSIAPKQTNSKPQRTMLSMSYSKTSQFPGLIDDFYLNLVDWSCYDKLAVAIKSKIYLVSSDLRKKEEIYQISKYKYIGSVNFNNTNKLGVGDSEGNLRILDLEKQLICSQYENHYGRIGSIRWFQNLVASGSKEGIISICDIRTQKQVLTYSSHSKEICGIKWNSSGSYIASGANDTILSVFDIKKSKQLVKFTSHNAAVKALDWNPFDNNVIASGGGTSDKKIRFFSMKTLEQVYSIDTGTQISNLSFSKISNQMVTTHGYSLNQINVWDTKQIQQSIKLLGTLRGHNRRVLFLANSPNGQSIVTGAGDETIKMWNVFQNDRPKENCLDISSVDLR